MLTRRALLWMLFIPFSALGASKTYDPTATRLKISDVAVVERAEYLRAQLYPEWSGGTPVSLPVFPTFLSSPLSPPPALEEVRRQMSHAASLAGEIELMGRLEADELRWNNIVTSVDQLASDSHTAFVSHSHGRRLEKEVGRRFIQSLDPWRVLFSSQQVSGLLADRQGLERAISGQDLAWVDHAAQQARSIQATLIQDSIVALKSAPTDGTLPSRCLNAGSWTIKPSRFFRKDRLEAHRLAGFCDSLASRLVPLKKGATPAQAMEDLGKEYAKLSEQLRRPSSDEHYLSFIVARLSVLDPHSTYVPPTAKSDFVARMAAAYVGLGLNVSFSSGVASFARVNESGPAYEAGIRAGDQLLAIGLSADGILPVSDLSPERVLAMMSGVEGGAVWLRIKDGAGVEQEKVVRRRRVEIQSDRVRVARLDPAPDKPAVVHVRVSSFYKDVTNPDRLGGSTTADVRRALQQARPGDWVLLDLRGNGGGLLDEALGVSGLFMPVGPVVQVEQPSGKVQSLDGRSGLAWSGPLVLLVDRATGSASEIVAGALQDYGRALVLGERTFGKGTAQSLFDLDGWSGAPAPVYGQVNLTAMRFYRPSGVSTQLLGVEPDVDFLPSHGGGREVSLDRAMPPSHLASLLSEATPTHPFAACLPSATSKARALWSGSVWAKDWSKSLEEIKSRPINLDARKRFIDDRIAVRERLKTSLSDIPGNDAPLFVTLAVLPLLQSCLSSAVPEPQ